MSINLIVPEARRPHWQERFRFAAPWLEIHDAGQSSEDVDYAFVWLPPPGELAAFPNLKVIFSMGAGVDHVFADPHLPDVPIVRIVDEDLTKRMGEWVVLHVLLHHRQFKQYDALQRKAEWEELRQPAAADIRVGIMGLGVIGAHCARLLRDVGFQVAGWSNSRKAIDGVESFAGQSELAGFLNRTDVLVNLLPLTPQTKGVIDKELLSQLAQGGALGGPFLVNGGRGGSQIEGDIVACLNEGTLLGASLDVFENEPLSSGSPLWAHPAVFITPHVAAISDPAFICAYVAGQIERFESGKALENVVSPDLRY
ncbi:MAG: 2-hydroxyacid dehydrogenase [Hyphomicrobiales bacterium]